MSNEDEMTENQIQVQAESREEERYAYLAEQARQEYIEQNPRYVDPPVVHLEQVLWCCWCLINNHYKTEAITIFNGKALCERHLDEHNK